MNTFHTAVSHLNRGRQTPWKELTAAATLAAMCMGLAHAQAAPPNACGDPFRNHFGPYDYRKASAGVKQLVEGRHFTPGIESMTRPSTTMMHDMAADVAYTLEVFPNHHRALLTMQRLSERHRQDPAPGGKLTVDCWYDRAVRYAPDDTVVRALYAQFLAKQGRREQALAQLAVAVGHAKDNPLSHYNIGLVYFELGAYDEALAQAHKARALGLERPELAERLRQANRWKEPGAGAN